MIEAPEARILCRQLNETVRGKKITDVYTQFSPHKFAWFTGSSEEYAEQLSGKTIPGLGNGVLQDILYHTHIHPKKKISGLTDKERENLFYQIKETMNDIYHLGGRSTESDLFGANGKYVACLSKDTAGMACPVAEKPLRKRIIWAAASTIAEAANHCRRRSAGIRFPPCGVIASGSRFTY